MPKACLSLQAAAKKFIGERSGKTLRRNVKVVATCEISPDCQSVLKNTYGCCNFPSVMDVDFKCKRGNFCTTHGKYCQLAKSNDPECNSVKFKSKRFSKQPDEVFLAMSSFTMTFHDLH